MIGSQTARILIRHGAVDVVPQSRCIRPVASDSRHRSIACQTATPSDQRWKINGALTTASVATGTLRHV
jgi:hypothetical protein